MFQKTLLTFSLLFLMLNFSGCVERGYKLTMQVNKQTIIAERISSIDETPKEDKEAFKNMQQAVKKAMKSSETSETSETSNSSESSKFIKKKKDVIKSKTVKKHRVKSAGRVIKKEKDTYEEEPEIEKEEISKIENPKTESVTTHPSKNIINDSIQDDSEESRLQEIARKSKELREARLREASKLKDQILKKYPKSKRKEQKQATLERILFEKQQAEKERERREREKNNNEQARQKQLIEEERRLKEQKRQKEDLIKKQREEQQRIEQERIEQERIKKNNELKHSQKPSKEIKSNSSTTEVLIFKQIDKVYHKFGNSEVHGHVIYQNSANQEIQLSQTKVYLLPVSAKLNYWFAKYYLKNKTNPKHKKTIASYLNKTTLNVEKNFEFFGVPEGSYYVIIESNYSNKKVYIAKKIKVGKYKKVMGVFSKKL